MKRKPSISKILCGVVIAFVLAFSGVAFSAALPCDGFAATVTTSSKVNVSKLTVSAIPNQGYTGKALTPKPTVKYGSKKLVAGTDYTLKYANNVKKGTATVTITGKGSYTGSRSVTFRIVARTSLASATVSVAKQGYTGKALTPAPTVKLGTKTLKAGTDYTVKYANNVKKGTATVTITGKNLYYGTKTATFKIVTRTYITAATVSGLSAKVYTGSAITPKPVVKMGTSLLKAGTHYTLSYKNNVKAGTATVTITGKNLYRGTKTATFKIAPAAISSTKVSGIANATWTGSAIKPSPVVKLGTKTLVKGTDYTVAYKNNVNAGTATITIAGKGNFSGSKTVSYKISKANMANAVIAAIPQQTYTGESLSPKPIIKLGAKTLVEGKDYTLSYSNNTAGGTASVTATGIGSMYGSKTVTFEIAVPTIEAVSFSYKSTGGARLNIKPADFNKVFSYGDAIDVEFSNGYTIKNIPYYNGYYEKLGAPLIVSYLGEVNPEITTNYGESIWQVAGLSSDMTVTLKLAGKGVYSTVQDALNVTYTNKRSDYPSDAAFANFRQIVGGNLNGKLYRSASPISNWRWRAAYASALAESAGIAFVLNLADTSESIQSDLDLNRSMNVDTSYYESLFNAGAVEPLNMNASYTTCEYQQKICAGLAVMAHRDGPYLIHCLEGKDRTGFTCILLEALAGSSYDEILADYMETYANYCFVTKEGTPEKYAAIKSVYFDSMIDTLMNGSDDGDYATAARRYLLSGGMSDEDIDLLVEKLTG